MLIRFSFSREERDHWQGVPGLGNGGTGVLGASEGRAGPLWLLLYWWAVRSPPCLFTSQPRPHMANRRCGR